MVTVSSSSTKIQTKPGVAVIMRSKDEMPYIGRSLESLSRQTFHSFALYNIDSGSTDGSLECVRKYNLHPERIFQIAPETYIPGAVLNTMVARATEPVIVFLNADAIPQNPEWLERLVIPIINGEADGTMSRQIAHSDAYFIVKQDYLRAYDPTRFPQNKLENFFSAVACAFRRDLWEKTKFYTQGLSEDLDWVLQCQKRGAHFKIVEDSVVKHSHNYDRASLYHRYYHEGVSFAYIYRESPRLPYRLFGWLKELTRDFLAALRYRKIHTIPYNIFYRTTIHLALYQGLKEGTRRYLIRSTLKEP